MTGVNHDGQMRFFLKKWNRCKRQCEAGVILEGANSTLAEDDIWVSCFKDIFGRKQQFLDGGGRSPFEKHGKARLTSGFQKRIILHVSGADLQDIGHLCDHGDKFWRHHLGENGQTRLLSRLGQKL